MIKEIIYTLLFCAIVTHLSAQLPSCNGSRYNTYVFANVDSTVNVQFGQNTTMNNVNQNLYMNIYEPQPDTVSRRPLIIFIHGGAFVAGDRSEGTGFCLTFALQGYVAATIDYRLIDVPLVDSLTVTEGMIQAISDAKAAIRFFVEDAATANIYKIDTNYIFIAGGSAGAITAVQTAYLDATDNIPPYIMNLINSNGGFAGNSSANTNHTTPIRGVLSYSGGMLRKDWISTGEPPMISVHDIGDTIVPCNYTITDAFPFPVYLYGACEMKQEADLKGVYNDTLIFPGSGHGAYFQNSSSITLVLQRTDAFLYNLVCLNTLSQNEIEDHPDFSIYPNPATDEIQISNTGNAPVKNIRIYSVCGQLMYTGNSTAISVKDLPEGLYFLAIETSNSRSVHKIIKE